jgi:hypothetical protein
MKYLVVILLGVTLLVVNAQAQQVPAKVTAEIIATSSTQVVKGAPFSADAISESIQILSDGNKIARSNTTRMYRDGAGRFRREDVPALSGAVGSVVGIQQAISIFDPVSSTRFLLNPIDKTARKIPSMFGTGEGAVIVNGQALNHAVKQRIETTVAAQRTQILMMPTLSSQGAGNMVGKTETLGTRDFEGVEAEGSRTVTTLAAGTIGNEKPIEIVYERWYSKELQQIVMSRHSDPRFGEQTYRLTNISRSEPDQSLFAVPADYKVVAEPTFNVVTTKPAFTTKTYVTTKP